MPSTQLTQAWSIAAKLLSGADPRAVLETLPERTRETLIDGAGGLATAAELLRRHGAEALVAERLVGRVVGAQAATALGPGDPADRLLATLSATARRKAADAIDEALASAQPAADELWPDSFSTRAQKRRGGVYTEVELIDLLLELVGWEGRGRLLEPAAGAGAFLVRALQRGRAAGVPAPRLAERIVGNDLHPFACRAARTALALAAPDLPTVTQGDALLGPEDAPTEQEGRWEFVVGNPPYVRGERIPADLRRRYKDRYGKLSPGNVDLASYFVQRALRWLAPGGKLGFVVTQGLFEARSSGGLRTLLGEKTIDAVVTLEWAPPQFAEATVIPCLLVVTNAPPPPGHQVALGRASSSGSDGPLRLSWTPVRQDSWLALSRGPWALHLQRGDLGWLRRLREAPTPLRAGYGLAVRTRAGAGALIAEGPGEGFRHPRKLIDGREVRPWRVDYAGRTIDYRPELISDPKSEEFFACPKVVVPRIALTPQAAVDEGADGPLFARNTVMVVRAPGTSLDAAPHALAALINSLPVRAYAFHLLRAGVLAGSHRATFYSGMIGALPIPSAVLDDAAIRRRLAQLAQRAQRLAKAGTPEGLAAVEALIDDEVATAFGLSASQLAGLRARSNREPLRSILCPVPAGSKTRRIAIADYAAGARYR